MGLNSQVQAEALSSCNTNRRWEQVLAVHVFLRELPKGGELQSFPCNEMGLSAPAHSLVLCVYLKEEARCHSNQDIFKGQKMDI